MFVRYRELLVLMIACVLAAPAPATSPRDELLRLVPDDVGFCLVVQDLRGKAADLLASPFARDWAKLSPGLAAAEEWEQLATVEGYLKKHLGVTWADLRDEILGDAFVLAYRSAHGEKTDPDQGLFLVRARDAKKLQAMIDKLNALQRETGELRQLVEKEHRGVKYLQRLERKETNYYQVRGSVLLFTGQEPILKRAIDRDKDEAAEAVPKMARTLKDLRLDKALVALVLNPRPWDEAIAKGARDDAGKMVSACWKALDAVGVGIHLSKEVRLELTMRARPEALPPTARKFLAPAEQSAELWASFPEDALLALSGQVDAVELYRLVGSFLSKSGKEKLEGDLARTFGAVLGRDIVKEVLPAIGPDWGLCVTAPAADAKAWTPRAVFALKVQKGDENDPVDEALFSGVQTWAQLAVLGHNKLHANAPLTLKTRMQDRVKVRFLEGTSLPPGVQPAFALKGGFLLLATSPAEIQGLKLTRPAQTGAKSMPLARLSLKDWRAYLKDRREPLAIALAEREDISKEKARLRIDSLRDSLGLIDRVELRRQAAPGLVTYALTLQPAQPLRKGE